MYVIWLKPDGTKIKKEVSVTFNNKVGYKNGYGWIIIDLIYYSKDYGELHFSSLKEFHYWKNDINRKCITLKLFINVFSKKIFNYIFYLKNYRTYTDIEFLVIIVLLLILIFS